MARKDLYPLNRSSSLRSLSLRTACGCTDPDLTHAHLAGSFLDATKSQVLARTRGTQAGSPAAAHWICSVYRARPRPGLRPRPPLLEPEDPRRRHGVTGFHPRWDSLAEISRDGGAVLRGPHWSPARMTSALRLILCRPSTWTKKIKCVCGFSFVFLRVHL